MFRENLRGISRGEKHFFFIVMSVKKIQCLGEASKRVTQGIRCLQNGRQGILASVHFISCRGKLLEKLSSHLPQPHSYSNTANLHIYIYIYIHIHYTQAPTRACSGRRKNPKWLTLRSSQPCPSLRRRHHFFQSKGG